MIDYERRNYFDLFHADNRLFIKRNFMKSVSH